MEQPVEAAADIAVSTKSCLIVSKCRPHSVEDRTFRIEANQAAVILAGDNTTTLPGDAPHFLQHDFGIRNMLEDIPSVNEIETTIRELQLVRVSLNKQNGGDPYGGIDLGRGSFDTYNLYVGRRLSYRGCEQSKTAAHLQNMHAGLDIEEFDEGLIR